MVDLPESIEMKGAAPARGCRDRGCGSRGSDFQGHSIEVVCVARRRQGAHLVLARQRGAYVCLQRSG